MHDSGIRRTLRILVGWGLALTLLFVGCGFLSYFINISVGQGSLSRNLAADAALLLLVLTFLAVRWKRVGAAEMSFLAYFGKLLTRCTPKSVTATPTRTLSAVAGTVIVLLVTFLATPATSSEFTVAQGRNGVLIIFAALGCLVGNALVVRWRNRPR
ncbi:hypothetical protein ALI22I_02630 [Saccharothrix sp. ALI-22-I]|nr:hypothetical protein ALI22I_02630 [Saccharothrix sp. ALI-22-I]